MILNAVWNGIAILICYAVPVILLPFKLCDREAFSSLAGNCYFLLLLVCPAPKVHLDVAKKFCEYNTVEEANGCGAKEAE